VRSREEDLIEVRWARQDSYVHAEEVTPQPARQHMVLDQIHGDFSHEPLVEESPSWAKPFVLASVEATHVSSNVDLNFTRFSFGIGGRIRLYASRHFGFKIQAEWLPVLANPQAAFICGGGMHCSCWRDCSFAGRSVHRTDNAILSWFRRILRGRRAATFSPMSFPGSGTRLAQHMRRLQRDNDSAPRPLISHRRASVDFRR
jgi:hypothetical protein